jgi:hypothetical protein
MQCWDYAWLDGNDLTGDLAGSIQTCGSHITLIHFPLFSPMHTTPVSSGAPMARGPDSVELPWRAGEHTPVRMRSFHQVWAKVCHRPQGGRDRWVEEWWPNAPWTGARWCHRIELGCGGAPQWAHPCQIPMVATASLVTLRSDPNNSGLWRLL